MQNVKFYVAAPQTLGTVRDYANAKNESAPTLVRGCEVELKMRLFANSEGTAPYPMEQLDGIVSWQWAMDKDFSESTNYILEADNANISVASVIDEVDGTEIEYTEISIPISNMNTTELAEWLGTGKSQSGLNGELVGFDENGKQIFVLQVENFTIRNRITSLGSPSPIEPDYMTAAQIRALIAAGIDLQFSDNGEQWHDAQQDRDVFFRMRSASDENALWSGPIALIVGPKGATGNDSFCYVAYASDADGSDFSLTPSSVLKYRAEIHVQNQIDKLTETDFLNAVWVKYIGEDGSGVGDMTKAIYDTNNDGIVDKASRSDYADKVPWSGVTDRPLRFPAENHTHVMSDLSNPVFQAVYSAADPKILYLNSPIVRNTQANGSGMVNLEFTAIMTSFDGVNYLPEQNEMLTWEYHVLCSATVIGVSVGSVNCSMVGVNIPESLELVNNKNSYHVFVIRALKKSGAVNGVCFQANYAYSYEA